MKIFFFINIFLVVYIYVGYPLLVKLLSIVKAKTVQKNDVDLPRVSILISAFNEEEYIGETIQNKILLDYPSDKLEIIVVSDGSTDGTERIVENLAAISDIPVKFFRQPHTGKAAGLNLIVPKASGDIIIFSDANSIYTANTLRNLVRNFADPGVGYVTGKLVYTNTDGSLVGDGCSSYMKYENWLREKETLLGSIVGVDGGIDAMRKALYEPMRVDQITDFVQPLKIVEKGYRVVYEPNAILKEQVLNTADNEYSMRVRVALRALWALRDMSPLLNPLRYGLFSFQLLSHKLLRYLAFIPIVLIFCTNIALLPEGGIYIIIFVSQLLFYFLAWQGMHFQGKKDIPIYLTFPYYFTLLNLACFSAVKRFLKGEKQIVWRPRVG